MLKYQFLQKQFLVVLKIKNLVVEDNLNVNEDKNIEVNTNHFLEAIEKISPSLSKSEIKKYEDLKKKYEA